MRACPACGASNGPTDDFCGNCGAYLGWSDTAPAPSAPSSAPPSPPTSSSSSRVAPPEPAPSEPAPSQSPAGAGPVPTHTGPAEGPAGREPAPEGPDPARAAPPATGDAPGPGSPAAPGPPAPEPVLPVRPAKPVAPRPVVRPAAVEDEVAGVPCPSCGTPNQPERRFCRRCAAPLHTTAKPDPLPWWRTVWPFRRRVRARSGRGVRFLVILAVVAALCAGGVLLLPAGRALYEDTRDKLGKPTPVSPVKIRASAEVPGHPATNTIDGLNNRYWGAPGPSAWITYTFRKPFRLVDLAITNGASVNAETYAHQARALQIDLEVTTSDSGKHHTSITLGDKPGCQQVSTGISDVTSIRLTLRSPTGLGPDRHLALAEVEFFQRGSAGGARMARSGDECVPAHRAG